MKSGEEIRNETDPFLREIWAAGWDDVYLDKCTWEIVLMHEVSGTEKRIENIITPTGYNWLIKRGILPDGSIHSWIADSNGDCQRFRELIGTPPQNP